MTADSGWALGSTYLLHECVGRGATGEVWLATSRNSAERLAVKLLRRELADDPDVRFRFLHEGLALGNQLLSLAHPGIVATRDLVAEGQQVGLVMEFVPGPSLREYLAEERTLPPALACRLTAEIAAAVGAAHALRIVHRDLKPENVLLQPTAHGPVARVVDFGVARLRHGHGLTSSAQVPGTLPYLAPELLTGSAASPASDVYALGLLFCELLVGRRPGRTELDQLRARRRRRKLTGPLTGLPQPLLDPLVDCLSADPRRRPGADELAARLRPMVASLAGTPAQPAAPPLEVQCLLADGSTTSTAGAGLLPSRRWPLPRWPGHPYASAGAAAGVIAVLAAALAGPELIPGPDQPAGVEVVRAGAGLGSRGLVSGDSAVPASQHPSLPARVPEPTAEPGETGTDPPVQAPGGTAAVEPPDPVGDEPAPLATVPARQTPTAEPGASSGKKDGSSTAPIAPVPAPSAPAPGPPDPAPTTSELPPTPTAPPSAPAPAPAPEPEQLYSATRACGSGFAIVDQQPLSQSVVYLLWNGQTQQNCVVTLKTANVGTRTATTAYLKPDGGAEMSDEGMYKYYAEVTAETPGCISWGGSDGAGEFRSPSGTHCGG